MTRHGIRSRKRSRLRWLILIALGSTGLGAGCRTHREEQQIIDQLKAQGIMVQVSPGQHDYNITVQAHGPTVTDDLLQLLTGLPGLWNLSVQESQVSDAGMQTIATMRQLRGLNLALSRVTNDGLVHLRDFPLLEKLSLRGLPIDGDGLRHLEGLPELHMLDLTGTRVDDEDLQVLTRFPQLSLLILENVSATGEGLQVLRDSEYFRSLRLGGPHITDAGLTVLNDFENLRELTLTDCPNVTDEWLNQIPRTTSLRTLNLVGTRVSPEAVEQLHRLFPEIEVRMMEAPDRRES